MLEQRRRSDCAGADSDRGEEDRGHLRGRLSVVGNWEGCIRILCDASAWRWVGFLVWPFEPYNSDNG
jgi:hypothetical protein